jgi:hypothetical protein
VELRENMLTIKGGGTGVEISNATFCSNNVSAGVNKAINLIAPCSVEKQSFNKKYSLYLMNTGSSLPHPQQRDTGPYQVLSSPHSQTIFFTHGSADLVDLNVLYDFPRSHSDTPKSVGLLWTSDQPVLESST